MKRNVSGVVRRMFCLVGTLCVGTVLGCGGDHTNIVGSKPPQWTWVEGASEVSDDASRIFGSKSVIPIHLTVAEGTWHSLNANAIELDDTKTYARATVRIDGVEVGTVGLRPKGGHGTLRGCFDDEGVRICDKLSYKLKFSEFEKGKRFLGLSRLNLHSAVRDSSFMRDYLAYGLFRRMGVDAPRVGFAELFVNGESQGLFLTVEQVDKRFLESRFPDSAKGNLYKGAWPSANSGDYYSDLLRTNKTDANHDSLEQFGAALEAAGDDALPGLVSQWMDLEQLDKFVAVDHAITNWDGPLTFRVGSTELREYRSYNFYLYQPEPEHFVLIPWDMDHTFAREHRRYSAMPSPRDLTMNCAVSGLVYAEVYERDFLVPSCDPLIRGLALSAEQPALQQLREGPFDRSGLLDTIDWLQSLLVGVVERDPTIGISQWLNNVEGLQSDIAYLQDKLSDQ